MVESKLNVLQAIKKGGVNNMDILLWIVFGALAGWIASMIMGTDAEQGAILNIVLGVIGAIVGGFVVNLFGASGVSGFNFYSLLVAILGAVIVVWVAKMFRHTA
jgi:uncharacterized membrane protein YeaQ/YmgE (transglycosylase-associated protein family)